MFQQAGVKLLSGLYGFAHPPCQHQLLYSYRTKETGRHLQHIDHEDPALTQRTLDGSLEDEQYPQYRILGMG